MQPGPDAASGSVGSGFNPHPPLRASATLYRLAVCFCLSVFQSSPAPEGECNTTTAKYGSLATTGFNPHPPLRASATCSSTFGCISDEMFQSSPAPEGECNLISVFGLGLGTMFQSSPAPEGECN